MAFLLAAFVETLVELGEAASFAELSLQTTAIVDVGLTAVSAQILVPIVVYSQRTRGRSTSEKSGSDDQGMDVDDHYTFESPCFTPDDVMSPINKRPISPIETPKPKRLDRQEKRDRDVNFTGPSYNAGWCRDFSGIQRTRVNPSTGRIIGYKGIPRKRALSPTSKYSSFWRDQKYAKPSLHAARSPGIWDSARR